MAPAAEFPRFARDDLQRFLEAVDRNLEASAQIIVIGGSAMLLRYGVEAVTNDVDTFESDQKLVDDAAKKARLETGLQIPLGDAKVADVPYHFKDRVERILSELGRLLIFVPERHDLTLSKMVRGLDNDFQAVAELHQNEPLELEVLVKRYQEEMDHVVTDPTRLRLTFLLWIEWLFGEIAAVRTKAKLAHLQGPQGAA